MIEPMHKRITNLYSKAALFRGLHFHMRVLDGSTRGGARR